MNEGRLDWDKADAGDWTWEKIWQLTDFLDLRDWLDYQHHVAAHDAAKT